MRPFKLLLLPVIWCCGIAPGASAEDGLSPLTFSFEPIESFEIGRDTQQFGELEFRGGLELIAKERTFGSLSGLDIDEASGRIVAVADTGYWFTARLRESNGRLVGLDEARFGRMLDSKGNPLRHKDDSDAEAVRLVNRGGPAALVAFEQSNDLRLFRGTLDQLGKIVPTELRVPEGVAGMQGNRGVEALAVAPALGPLKGATLMIGERSLDAAGNLKGWILDGPLAGMFAIRRIGTYDISDADFAPNGDLWILERRFSIAGGLGMRIRRIAAADIRPGMTVSGSIVMEAGMVYQIDNMEGLALRRGPGGETLVLIVSDDNQSILERTLLLEFAWRPPVAAATGR